MAGVFLVARRDENYSCFLSWEPEKPTENMEDLQGGGYSR